MSEQQLTAEQIVSTLRETAMLRIWMRCGPLPEGEQLRPEDETEPHIARVVLAAAADEIDALRIDRQELVRALDDAWMFAMFPDPGVSERVDALLKRHKALRTENSNDSH